MYFHASQTKGITQLEPRESNHGIPQVYLSVKREHVLVYLSNAVEKYCLEQGQSSGGKWHKWGTYGFDQDGILVMEEYYPNALADTYKGVKAYIYSVDVSETLEPLDGIPDAFISKKAVDVIDCEVIPDAYEEIMNAARHGAIKINSYQNLSSNKKEWIRQTIQREYDENPEDDAYRFFLKGKFPMVR